jgi:hypothetical protein
MLTCTNSEILAKTLAKLPEWVANNGMKAPHDAYNGPFQYAMGTDLHLYDYLLANPRLENALSSFMRVHLGEGGKGGDWYDFYPVAEKLTVSSPEQPLLIDLGGGLGHDLEAFAKAFPNLPGRLILQDRPSVIDDIKELDPRVERMKHSFFDPNPVKGAKAYYIRGALHDWPDKQATTILEHIKAAMGPDSMLLVNDIILPDTGVSFPAAAFDLSQMCFQSGQERTKKQWQELLESVGFELVKVWSPKAELSGSGHLMEAVLKK